MNVLKLPNYMQDVRALLRALDWHTLEQEVARETASRLVIVGPVNSGKSTLFNRLHGHNLSAVSAVPGTTSGVVEHPLGPFLLVDTPGFGEVWGVDRAAVAEEAVAHADLTILLLDAVAGVRQSDLELYERLLAQDIPVIVALNKSDLIRKELPYVLENAEKLLQTRPIPISAKSGDGVVDKLIPMILSAQPGVAVAMARALPSVREHVVNQIVRRAAWVNALIALSPVPGLDIPLLLVSQTRLVLRIAAVYGQSMSVSHARELLTTMAGSLLSRYAGQQLAKLVPGLGWLVSAGLSAMTTWGIGQASRQYFEADGRIGTDRLKSLYQRMRRLAPKRWLARRSDRSLSSGDSAEA